MAARRQWRWIIPTGDAWGTDRRLARLLGTDWVDLYQIHRFDSTGRLRGDHGGSPRRGEGRKSPLHRCLLHVDMAVRADAGTQQNFTAGPASCPCRTSTTWCSAKKNARCTPTVWPPGVEVCCRGHRWRGVSLTRDWDNAAPPQTSSGVAGRRCMAAKFDRAIAARSPKIKGGVVCRRAQIALAWVRQQPTVTAPIVGVTKTHHFDDAIASLSITLTDAELAMLTDPYVRGCPRDSGAATSRRWRRARSAAHRCRRLSAPRCWVLVAKLGGRLAVFRFDPIL